MLTKTNTKSEFDSLSLMVKECINRGDFESAEKDIVDSMAESPHNAVPHNLMGILMEHKNDHILAMKHFRAAWALDPTFRPARFNMEKYGACFGSDRYKPDAYEDSDCPSENEKRDLYKIEYDDYGIGHAVRR